MSAAAPQPDIVGDVCRIESLLRVCAYALEGTRDFSDGPRYLADDEIRAVLEFAADLLGETAVQAERALAKKGREA